MLFVYFGVWFLIFSFGIVFNVFVTKMKKLNLISIWHCFYDVEFRVMFLTVWDVVFIKHKICSGSKASLVFMT